MHIVISGERNGERTYRDIIEPIVGMKAIVVSIDYSSKPRRDTPRTDVLM